MPLLNLSGRRVIYATPASKATLASAIKASTTANEDHSVIKCHLSMLTAQLAEDREKLKAARDSTAPASGKKKASEFMKKLQSRKVRFLGRRVAMAKRDAKETEEELAEAEKVMKKAAAHKGTSSYMLQYCLDFKGYITDLSGQRRRWLPSALRWESRWRISKRGVLHLVE